MVLHFGEILEKKKTLESKQQLKSSRKGLGGYRAHGRSYGPPPCDLPNVKNQKKVSTNFVTG